ncbi:hypothetical protein [Flavisphingomonas formosensis]|uniref:hypothetical protein n=1 Tax=Flavisphingomonas formosensis TaxID=861534 RepID=UPI0012F8526D|nr:hypothetical protein [Sphingomonas formosensis]
MTDQADPIALIFSISSRSDMIAATGALLRERVEITAQSIQQGKIFGRADRARIERLRSLPEFAAVEEAETDPVEPSYAAAVVTLWGWSSSIRVTPMRPARPARPPRRIIQRIMG